MSKFEKSSVGFLPNPMKVNKDNIDSRKIELSLPKDYISFSQVSLFKTCPRAYYYRYILDRSYKATPELIQGKSIHAALETNFSQKIDSKVDLPISDVLDSFTSEYDNEIKLNEVETIFKEALAKKRADSISMLGSYIKAYAPTIQPDSVEEEFNLILRPGLVLKGFVDLVQKYDKPAPIVIEDKIAAIQDLPNRDKMIVDHKVTTRTKPQSDADSDLQLSIYAKAFNVPNVRFDAILAEKGAIKQTISHRTPEDCDFAISVVVSVAEAISQGSFPKLGQGTWKCNPKHCAFYFECHAKKD